MKKYPFPEKYEKKSSDFTVSCMGENIEVYSCDVSKYPLNRVFQGKQREFRQTERASFVMLGSDGCVILRIHGMGIFYRESAPKSIVKIVQIPLRIFAMHKHRKT